VVLVDNGLSGPEAGPGLKIPLFETTTAKEAIGVPVSSRKTPRLFRFLRHIGD